MKGLRLLVYLVIVAAFLVARLSIDANQTKADTKTEKKEVAKEAPASAPKTTFKWTPTRAGVTKAQVVIGRGVVCPFEFAGVDPKVKKVKLSIKDEKHVKMGIIVADEEVAISEGKAASSAMFSVPAGTRLGNYELTIVAKDAATGEVISEGMIPFQLLPKGAGGC
jgi:hypothetical protein